MTVPTVRDPQAALAQLFRHSLRDGRLHPLLHIAQRYRREAPR